RGASRHMASDTADMDACARPGGSAPPRFGREQRGRRGATRWLSGPDRNTCGPPGPRALPRMVGQHHTLRVTRRPRSGAVRRTRGRSTPSLAPATATDLPRGVTAGAPPARRSVARRLTDETSEQPLRDPGALATARQRSTAPDPAALLAFRLSPLERSAAASSLP